MPKSLDDLMALFPTYGFAVYAYEPGTPLTLELLTPDGHTYTFNGRTLADAIEAAFPGAPPEPAAAPVVNIFD